MSNEIDLDPSKNDHGKLYTTLVSELREFVVVLVDRHGRCASWNPGVEQHLGYTKEEFIGLEACHLFTPEDNAAGVPAQELKHAAKHGRAADIRWHVRKNGSRLFVDGVLIALRNDSGELVGFSKVMRDITERKLHEDRLEELTRALKQAQIIVRSMDGHIQFWSAGAERIYGYSEAAAQGKIVHELLKTEFPQPLPEIEAELFKNGIWHGELKHTRSDGCQIIVASDWVLQSQLDGRRGLVIEANTDVTGLKSVGETLLRANEELQHFAYAASHDLQEPLRTVRTYSQLLRRRYEGKLDGHGAEFLQTIERSAAQMEQLISDLLDYLRTGEPAVREVNMEHIVDAALLNLKSSVEESGAEISYESLPVLSTDPARLTMVFQNLFANAIKYRSEEPPRVHVAAKQASGDWLFVVHDNGIGFEQKYAEQIFQVFKRLHPREVAGTGIGLAICKRVIEREGGRIWAESEPGRGSTFYFTLPVER